MTRVIVVTSGKGGVGKTTFVSNIGRALSARKKKVVCIEGDIGLNNLDVVLGVEDKILYDAVDYARGKATVEQCLVPLDEHFYLFPCTSQSPLPIDIFIEIIEKLKTDFDYVLIDSPAGVEEGFHRSVIGASEGIIITTPHLTSIRDASKTVRFLSGYGMEKIGLVVNRVRGEYLLKKGETVTPNEIASILHLPLYGVLPEDEFVNLYNLADVVQQKSGSGYSYSLIASYLEGKEKKLYDCTAECKGIKNRFRRMFT